jgi:alpha-beta hydrolase superfamily lysophospholipase
MTPPGEEFAETATRERDLQAGGGRGTPSLRLRSVVPVGRRPPWARLALLHGYGDHGGRYQHVLEWMAARGVAAHALDFRGHGRATGRRGFVRRWDEYLDDLEAFLGHPDVRDAGAENAPLFLLGHSHGGLVLAVAGIRGRLPDGVAGAILSAPYLGSGMVVPRNKWVLARVADRLVPWLAVPADVPSEWMSSDAALQEETRSDPLVLSTVTPRWFLGMRAAQDEACRADAAGAFRLPLLVLMGDADRLADPAAARAFCARCGSPDKTFRGYPGHLHELLRETGRHAIFADILGWMRERAAGAYSRSA